MFTQCDSDEQSNDTNFAPEKLNFLIASFSLELNGWNDWFRSNVIEIITKNFCGKSEFRISISPTAQKPNSDRNVLFSFACITSSCVFFLSVRVTNAINEEVHNLLGDNEILSTGNYENRSKCYETGTKWMTMVMMTGDFVVIAKGAQMRRIFLL